MQIGDTVVRKSYGKDITFRIIDITENERGTVYIMKGINLRLIADSPEDDLEQVRESYSGDKDELFNRKINKAIKKVLASREDMYRFENTLRLPKSSKLNSQKDLIFGRPGRVLHVDADPEYLEACLKVYKQLGIEAAGKIISEREQQIKIVELVKTMKPDIVVLTGHDSILKNATDYTDINNYRSSKYFVEAVNELRNYQSSYDELVIFAGACQSCYEKLLDSGANYTKVRFFGQGWKKGDYFFLASSLLPIKLISTS